MTPVDRRQLPASMERRWSAALDEQALDERRKLLLGRWARATPHFLDHGARLSLSPHFLWAPAQRKRATMLYFANVFFYLFFYGRLILRPWLTEVRENFTRGRP